MALTNNQTNWANIYLRNENDYAEIKEGKNPLDILESINAEISGLCTNLDSAADSACLERISKLSERIKDITNYLKETTVPV